MRNVDYVYLTCDNMYRQHYFIWFFFSLPSSVLFVLCIHDCCCLLFQVVFCSISDFAWWIVYVGLNKVAFVASRRVPIFTHCIPNQIYIESARISTYLHVCAFVCEINTLFLWFDFREKWTLHGTLYTTPFYLLCAFAAFFCLLLTQNFDGLWRFPSVDWWYFTL